MIIARFDGITVEITDAVNRMAYIRTLDGSKPFTALAAQSDPEEPPYPAIVDVDWTVVEADQLKDIRQCDHTNLILDSRGGLHFNGGEVWDDIHESLFCLECGFEIRADEQEHFNIIEPNF